MIANALLPFRLLCAKIPNNFFPQRQPIPKWRMHPYFECSPSYQYYSIPFMSISSPNLWNLPSNLAFLIPAGVKVNGKRVDFAIECEGCRDKNKNWILFWYTIARSSFHFLSLGNLRRLLLLRRLFCVRTMTFWLANMFQWSMCWLMLYSEMWKLPIWKVWILCTPTRLPKFPRLQQLLILCSIPVHRLVH